MHTIPRCLAQRSESFSVPTNSSTLPTPFGQTSWTCWAINPVSMNTWIGTAGTQQPFAVRVTSRRGGEGTVVFSDGRGSQPDRSRASTDQQTLAFFKTKRLE
jgi:hypothetical protein